MPTSCFPSSKHPFPVLLERTLFLSPTEPALYNTGAQSLYQFKQLVFHMSLTTAHSLGVSLVHYFAVIMVNIRSCSYFMTEMT